MSGTPANIPADLTAALAAVNVLGTDANAALALTASQAATIGSQAATITAQAARIAELEAQLPPAAVNSTAKIVADSTVPTPHQITLPVPSGWSYYAHTTSDNPPGSPGSQNRLAATGVGNLFLDASTQKTALVDFRWFETWGSPDGGKTWTKLQDEETITAADCAYYTNSAFSQPAGTPAPVLVQGAGFTTIEMLPGYLWECWAPRFATNGLQNLGGVLYTSFQARTNAKSDPSVIVGAQASQDLYETISGNGGNVDTIMARVDRLTPAWQAINAITLIDPASWPPLR